MKPLRLEVRGLTSFKDPQEINFAGLELFAISGPIGSGKSSLLDAITYALYGKVERVGDEVLELISPGQPRVAVFLEFEVQNDVYRVARSTGRGGSTVLLEKRVGEGWVTFGERADRVLDVNRMIRELVGLDYDAFTRTVLLPQGKFAEFLTGKADQRRRILTDLLGLQLFDRMAKRANEIARGAKARAEANRDLLVQEYGDVNREAVRNAKEDARSSSLRAKELVKVAAQLDKSERELDKHQNAIAQQQECADEIEVVVRDLGERAEVLHELADGLKELQNETRAAQTEFNEATTYVMDARKDMQQVEHEIGDRESLAVMREKLNRLSEVSDEIDEITSDLERFQSDEKQSLEELAAAKDAVVSASLTLERAAEAEREAQQLHDLAHTDDMVGSLTSGLDIGSPCPICSRPLESLPKAQQAPFEKARKLLARAKRENGSASKALASAEKEIAVLEQRLEDLSRERTRLQKEVSRRTANRGKLEVEITKAFRQEMPKDPEKELDRRIKRSDGLKSQVEKALKALDRAKERREEAKNSEREVSSEVKQAASAMKALRLDSLMSRAVKLVPTISTTSLLIIEVKADAEGLAKLAAKTSEQLRKVARSLGKAADQSAGEASKLFGQALQLLPDFVHIDADNIQSLRASVDEQAKNLAHESTLAQERASVLEKKLKAKRKLEDGERQTVMEHATYLALANELRADHLVDYLQSEALVLLADAASVHLSELSSGRYRLHFSEDVFYVSDDWNGEEKRPVRTLSGGETFLVALPLALALSDQVQALSVTEKTRLDSLFIDEGFGTLDPETLETVVSMIEQLGGDGRLVGVITHIAELADRLPVRVQIEKSPNGSRIVVAA